MIKDCRGKHSIEIICPILTYGFSVGYALHGKSDDKWLK